MGHEVRLVRIESTISMSVLRYITPVMAHAASIQYVGCPMASSSPT